MKKSIKMPYKIITIFMVIVIISLSVPVAFAAEVLNASNVSQWPTYNYKNGQETVFFGQTFDEALAINDDEIVLDSAGEQVAGHFEFKNPAGIPTSATSAKATIVFVPDDTSKYEGFSKSRSVVVYSVQKTTPVYIDEVNDPVVATKVEAGATLSTSILSGGKMTNPYNENEPILLARSWEWADPNTIVNESGYFYAIFYPANYNQVTAQVYVDIAVDIIESEISTIPSIPELTYDGVTTWNDITLSGGLAVEKGTSKAIEGTFSIAESWKVKVINAGTYEIDVTFTPNDTESYTKVDFKIPVTVNKAPIRFVDENGNDIVPEITVPYGTDFNYIPQLLKPYVKGAEYTLISLGDLENTKVTEGGTYTVTASAPSEGANYEKTELSFKIIIEKQKLNPKLYAEPGKLYIQDTSGTYRPEGTFTFTYYINDVEQGSIEGIKYLERFDWNPTKSGEYEYKIVYVEATENEHYIIEPFSVTNPLTLSWAFKAPGAVEGTQYPYGSEVALEAPATDPAKADKPYYGFVKWEDANGNTGLTEEELANREISFTMPDGDVELNATYKFDFCLFIQYYVQIVVDWFNSFFQSLGTLF